MHRSQSVYQKVAICCEHSLLGLANGTQTIPPAPWAPRGVYIPPLSGALTQIFQV